MSFIDIKLKRILFFLYFFYILCSAEVISQQNKPVTMVDLQGGWSQTSLITNEYQNPNMDSRIYTVRYNTHWWIERDSIYVIRYPCEYQFGFSFRIENDSIYYNNNEKAAAYLRFEGEVLVMTGTNPADQDYIKRYYRANFDKKVVNLLKRDSLNPDCLMGNMKLLTTYFPSDGEAVEHKYPIQLPKNLHIGTIEQVKSIYKTKNFTITVNGKKRLFYVDHIYWNSKLYNEIIFENTIINLKPADWWKGDDFLVQYIFR